MSILIPHVLATEAGRAIRKVKEKRKLWLFLSLEAHIVSGEKLEHTGEGGVCMVMPILWFPFLCFHSDSFTYTYVRPSDKCVFIHGGLIAVIFRKFFQGMMICNIQSFGQNLLSQAVFKG